MMMQMTGSFAEFERAGAGLRDSGRKADRQSWLNPIRNALGGLADEIGMRQAAEGAVQLKRAASRCRP